MMDLASRPLVRSLCSSSSSFQKSEGTPPAGEGAKEAARVHPAPPAGQASASRCPFLAAEMGQRNSGVVRQASMALQEDVSEVRTVCKGL
ncbi:5-aminolevulinate synthase, nonspecific, mitochondrial-like [Sinocyclocheilus grahami]|uniref:5-aminolevulinate synthase, nonspecific, mitochondrial-like n=1 Tax=Sinocyclocheilus grahami TaxID=75366 RepID=UPI0007AC6AFE|nr:PREDICTED: 5-aminolevulinate synthase, nonspecific, mitochondrial-like [Sinocyclocheilus grahami]